MEVLVLDTNFESIDILDSFESIIWTDRYSKCGDFEIYTPVNDHILSVAKADHYIWFRDSEYLMIVESIQIDSDIEFGRHVTISGRSLESILMRRIVWNQTTISGNLQTAIKTLITNSIISPAITDRAIGNFIFQESTDPAVTDITIVAAQYTGDSLYDIVVKLCESNGIGFKIILNSAKQFVFSLYKGVNRSYDQQDNPFVVFSPNFENIINSNYLESTKTLRNITLIAGEGEGSARRTSTLGAGTGLDRRELFTDARDISSTVDGGTLTNAQYIAALQQRGKENMAENKTTKTFEGQVEATQMFKYGEDFYLGDIVQIVNEFKMESKSRVEEIVRSQSEEGYDIYPTFTILDNEEE